MTSDAGILMTTRRMFRVRLGKSIHAIVIESQHSYQRCSERGELQYANSSTTSQPERAATHSDRFRTSPQHQCGACSRRTPQKLALMRPDHAVFIFTDARFRLPRLSHFATAVGAERLPRPSAAQFAPRCRPLLCTAAQRGGVAGALSELTRKRARDATETVLETRAHPPRRRKTHATRQALAELPARLSAHPFTAPNEPEF